MQYSGMLLCSLLVCAALAAGCTSTTGTGSPSTGTGYSPFGAGVEMPRTHTVAVSASQTGDTSGVATYRGGPDAGLLQWIEVSVNAGPRVPIGSASAQARVEQSVPLHGLTPGQEHVVAVGHFTDGQDLVVLDAYI
jgi:hypothetical protein